MVALQVNTLFQVSYEALNSQPIPGALVHQQAVPPQGGGGQGDLHRVPGYGSIAFVEYD